MSDHQVPKKARIKSRFLQILPEKEQKKTSKSALLLIRSWVYQLLNQVRRKEFWRKKQKSQELSILNFSSFIMTSWPLSIHAGQLIKSQQLSNCCGRRKVQEREDQLKLRQENLEKERISVEEWLLEKPMDIQHSRR